MLKNAANAIENEGTITINIIENLAKEEVFIDVSDTGKGIRYSKFDTVFQPGYTTRKRGWGLGFIFNQTDHRKLPQWTNICKRI